jgi:hypothetical protein
VKFFIPVRSISFATCNISVKPQETEAQCQLGILWLGLRGYEPKSTMQEKIFSDNGHDLNDLYSAVPALVKIIDRQN